MDLTVGAVLEGKVKSITAYGAFIALPGDQVGMVHISEVSGAYVSDIRQHLSEGQTVRVMVIGLDGGKIKLSIKRLQAPPRAPRAEAPTAPKTADQLFEEKLKQFMAESDSKISTLRQHDQPRRRRK